MAKKAVKTGKRTQKGREAQIRRMVESRDQRATAPVSAPQTEQYPASGPAVLQRRTAAATAARSVSRAEEYSFIMSDLRRVGILAGGMFAILIALSFVLR